MIVLEMTREKVVLEMTREEVIGDLSRAFREQNDLGALSNEQLGGAWKRHGIHTGTWDWDIIHIVGK